MNKKTRAKNLPVNSVGIQRYDLYRQALPWIDIAMAKGFNLEAITLIESIIADRLESYLTNVLGKDISFKTLGELISICKNENVDERLKALVITELNDWRNKRNNSLHAMVKIEEGDTTTWDDRMRELPIIAKEGKEILNKVKNRTGSIQKQQRNQQKREIRLHQELLAADERFKKFRQQMDQRRSKKAPIV